MMKRTIILALIITAATVLYTSCTDTFSVEEFRSSDDIGLTIKGQDVIKYDDTYWQTGYDEQNITFRVNDDNMADFFVLKCHSFPVEGQSVKADLSYTTDDDIKNKTGLTFDVTKTDDATGKIWLWNKKNGIGAIVKILR